MMMDAEYLLSVFGRYYRLKTKVPALCWVFLYVQSATVDFRQSRECYKARYLLFDDDGDWLSDFRGAVLYGPFVLTNQLTWAACCVDLLFSPNQAQGFLIALLA